MIKFLGIGNTTNNNYIFNIVFYKEKEKTYVLVSGEKYLDIFDLDTIDNSGLTGEDLEDLFL